MNYYTAPFTRTAASARDTARLCYRKGRRDTARVARLAHSIATHPRTVEAAKVAVWCLYLGAVVSYALGQTVRIYAQHWVDAQVSASLPVSVAPVPAEMTVDPFCPAVNPLPVVVAPVPALDDEAKKLEVSRLESLCSKRPAAKD